MTSSILDIKAIHKSFGGNKALNGISLGIEAKKITAIIGPNGSGKSTLFNILTRVLKQDSGEIFFKGTEISKKEDFQISSEIFSRTFQETRAFGYLSIEDHIKLALAKEDSNFFRSLIKPERFGKKIILDALALVGLEKPLESLGGDISYGQTKLLTLAMAVVKSHEMLFLDEPVAGVAPFLRQQIAKTLQKLRQAGETILLIEHDMNFVVRIADFIVVMDAGEVVAQGSADEIVNDKEVLRCYLGR